MQPRYVDFYDLPCSFAGAIATCQIIGRAGDADEVDLAIEGFVGDGYFVRKDAFVNSTGHETHRVYVTTHEAYDKLAVAPLVEAPEPVIDIPAPPEPFNVEQPVEASDADVSYVERMIWWIGKGLAKLF